MRIVISERLRPFSHLPGSYCILPGTTLRLQIFPALVRVEELAGPTPTLLQEIPIHVKGPVSGFTIQQDLERGVVSFWGNAASGYFRFFCIFDNGQVVVTTTQPKKQNLGQQPRLSLGSHKSQDWEQISRRVALEEIFPIWHRLGLMTPTVKHVKGEGSLALLEACSQVSKPEHIYPAFERLFKVGFSSMLSPTLTDQFHQGVELPPVHTASPLLLVTEGAKVLQSLFFREEGDRLTILPSLSPQFHCGRMVDVPFSDRGFVHFEWTKKSIRRAIFDAHASTSISFNFPKSIKEYRLREAKSRLGKTIANGSKVDLEVGKQYYLDNFQR